MEDKILQMIAWGITYGKVIIETILVILGTQFLVYQLSGHKINPLMSMYKFILNMLCKVAKVEI